ncbi:NUDIX hydrolase [Botrimarina sp.]|uniref:NUDIX hydrolase n=1 Tax=Botrimarina sp. TaxID=2795802 RepID=UPI0032ECCBB3
MPSPNDGDPITLYAGRHLTLRERDGWEYVSRVTGRPAVGVVAVTDGHEVVLVEQPRPPVGRSVVELPAGLAGDTAGAEDEPLLAAAQRELLEETGYTASRWTELVIGYSTPGLTDEAIQLYLAEGLTREGPGGGHGGEQITVHHVPLAHVIPWLQQRDAAADLKLFAGLYAAGAALTAGQRAS